MALHALSLLTQSRLIADIESHRDHAKLIVLPPPCPLAIQPIDFGLADELIARSLADTRAFLDGRGAERPRIRMRMHSHDHSPTRKKRAEAIT
jgi:NTE family protein